MKENELDNFCKAIGEVHTDFVETHEEYYFKITEG